MNASPALSGPHGALCRRHPRRAWIAALAALAALGCDPKLTTTPVTPGTPPPPLLESVFPAPRSVRVSDTTPVYAQFSADLDPATINATTVFFKLDTRRLPAEIRWNAASRRIEIVPQERLSLLRTYTVELSGGIEALSGAPLGQRYLWQFTVTSLRLPQSPRPMHRAVDESPLVALRWGGLTEATVGTIRYEVHAAADSATAADPQSPALATTAGAVVVPVERWRDDAPTWWAVHALNLTTGERRIAPAWRFAILPADTPVDSISPFGNDWAWYDPSASTPAQRLRCQLDSLVIAPGMLTTVRWQTGGPDSTLRVARAYVEASPRRPGVTAEPGASLWSVSPNWSACAMSSSAGPPFADRYMADAEVHVPGRMRFASDRLSAHVEAMIRGTDVFGFIVRAPKRMSVWGASVPAFGQTATQLHIVYYRRPPLAAATPGAAPAAPAR